MKKLVIALSLLASTFAFAGPEDHMNDTCFTAKKSVPGSIPSTFCFEAATLDVNSNKLNVSGYATNVPYELKTTTLFRKNEDFYTFVAKSVVWNSWESGCGEGLFAEVIISGEADFTGYIDAKSLHFSVNYEVTNDTCHSQPQESAVEYVLSK